MKILISLLLVLSFTTTFCGCSRIRQMTRRDYVQMDDPFSDMGGDDSFEDSQRNQIQTASQSMDSRERGSSSFASLQVDSSESRSGENQSNPFVGFTDRTEQGVAQAADRVRGFEQRLSADPPDLDEMARFVGREAEKSGMPDTARQLDADFAKWAAEQQQEWQHLTEEVEATAVPFVDAGRTTAEQFVPKTPAVSFGAPVFTPEPPQAEVATPFIQAESGQAQPTTATMSRPAVADVGLQRVTDPFAQEAGDRQSGRVTLQDTRPPTIAPLASQPDWSAAGTNHNQSIEDSAGRYPESGTLDSRFSFDKGWKPSEVERP